MGQELNYMDGWNLPLSKFVGGGTMKKMSFCGWRGQKGAVSPPPLCFYGKALRYDLVVCSVQ